MIPDDQSSERDSERDDLRDDSAGEAFAHLHGVEVLRRLLIDAHGSGPGVYVRASLIRAVRGDGSAAIYLAQLLFVGGRHADDEGWFYATEKYLKHYTGLSRKAQKRSRDRLVKLGIIEHKRRGMPARSNYRLDFNTLIDLLIRENSRISQFVPLGGQTSLYPKGGKQYIILDNYLDAQTERNVEKSDSQGENRTVSASIPTVEQAGVYFREQLSETLTPDEAFVLGARFIGRYAATDWRLGGEPIRNWQRLADSWIAQEKLNAQKRNQRQHQNDLSFDDFHEAMLFFDKWRRGTNVTTDQVFDMVRENNGSTRWIVRRDAPLKNGY